MNIPTIGYKAVSVYMWKNIIGSLSKLISSNIQPDNHSFTTAVNDKVHMIT